jgi:predicted nucleic acid-binding protein
MNPGFHFISSGLRWLVAQIGRPVPCIDSLLAATALHHELRLVTRNQKDFDYPGLEVVNPWS